MNQQLQNGNSKSYLEELSYLFSYQYIMTYDLGPMSTRLSRRRMRNFNMKTVLTHLNTLQYHNKVMFNVISVFTEQQNIIS